jgi:hypothetical protein
MCTVSYLPLAQGQYVLTASRDEHKTRPKALPPQAHALADPTYPQDPKGGGTWFAAAADGRTATLLNGAFAPYTPADNYRHSRGLVPLAALSYATVAAFIQAYPLEGLAPFTLILVAPQALETLHWTGQTLHHIQPDPGQPHIWSSATLYSPQAQDLRREWLAQWLAAPAPDPAAHLLDFHLQQQPHVAPHLRLRMETATHATVSVSQRAWRQPEPALHYLDLCP